MAIDNTKIQMRNINIDILYAMNVWNAFQNATSSSQWKKRKVEAEKNFKWAFHKTVPKDSLTRQSLFFRRPGHTYILRSVSLYKYFFSRWIATKILFIVWRILVCGVAVQIFFFRCCCLRLSPSYLQNVLFIFCFLSFPRFFSHLFFFVSFLTLLTIPFLFKISMVLNGVPLQKQICPQLYNHLFFSSLHLHPDTSQSHSMYAHTPPVLLLTFYFIS